jgi:hypothetical protein
MVEYGNGVSQATGHGGGSGGAGGGDVGAAIGQFFGDAVDTVSTTPPEILVLWAIVILAGLFILKRAL